MLPAPGHNIWALYGHSGSFFPHKAEPGMWQGGALGEEGGKRQQTFQISIEEQRAAVIPPLG